MADWCVAVCCSLGIVLPHRPCVAFERPPANSPPNVWLIYRPLGSSQDADVCQHKRPFQIAMMQLDDLLFRYFYDTDVASVSPDTLASGIERCLVDLGLEQDREKRFALWGLLHMLGSAPDLDGVFEDDDDREAARNFMDLLAGGQGNAKG